MDTEINSLKIMGIPIPDSIFEQYDAEGFIQDTLTNYLGAYSSKNGIYLEQVENDGGELIIQGNLPEELEMIED